MPTALQVWVGIARLVLGATSICTWYACGHRKRYDLVLIAMFVHVMILWQFEETTYIESRNVISETGEYETVYTALFKISNVTKAAQFAIDWGTVALFIYSLGLADVTYERVGILVSLIILFVFTISDLAQQQPIIMRFAVTMSMFVLYLYDRFTRTLAVYINMAFYDAGFLLFYAGFILSAISTFTNDPETHIIVFVFWILFTNMGIVCIIVSVPKGIDVQVRNVKRARDMLDYEANFYNYATASEQTRVN